MIDWKESLKLYSRYINWVIYKNNKDLCYWYQNLRYYND